MLIYILTQSLIDKKFNIKFVQHFFMKSLVKDCGYETLDSPVIGTWVRIIMTLPTILIWKRKKKKRKNIENPVARSF